MYLDDTELLSPIKVEHPSIYLPQVNHFSKFTDFISYKISQTIIIIIIIIIMFNTSKALFYIYICSKALYNL